LIFGYYVSVLAIDHEVYVSVDWLSILFFNFPSLTFKNSMVVNDNQTFQRTCLWQFNWLLVLANQISSAIVFDFELTNQMSCPSITL